MARKSRWAQFTDNFNGVYGTFNKIGKDIESTKVMNNEYEDDKGNALAGDALDRRRMQELSKVYTKYGDTKGGLDLRAQQAKIESDKRANDLARDTYDELVRQNGLLKSAQMRASTNLDISRGENLDADTATEDATRDLRVDGLELDNEGKVQNNRSSTVQANVDEGGQAGLIAGNNASNKIRVDDATLSSRTLDGRVAGANATNSMLVDDAAVSAETVGDRIITSGANTDSSVANAVVDGNAAIQSTDTLDSSIAAANAGNEADAADSEFKNLTSTLALEDLTREESLLTSIMGDDSYNTPEEAQDAYRAAIENDDTIPFERKNQILGALDKMGLEKLTSESAKLAAGAQSALQKGGMDGLVEYYDTIDDGDTMRIERNDDGTVSIIATRGDEETVLFSDNSEDAETIVTQQMFNQISRPGTGMEVAAAALDMEAKRASTEVDYSRSSLLDKQAFSELISQDVDKARLNLIESQTAQIDLAIEQSKSGLTGRAKIAEEGLADLLKKDQYILLAEDEPAAAAQLIGDFMQRYQMKGAPPAGVDAQSWFALSEAEQQEYIEAGR